VSIPHDAAPLPDWRFAAARGLAALALGLAVLFWPAFSLDTVLFAIGAFALVYGAVALVSAPGERGANRVAALAEGAAGVLLAGLVFLGGEGVGAAGVWLAAGWAAVVGAAQVAAAVARRARIPDEWLQGVSGASMLLFAALLAARPVLAGPAYAAALAVNVAALGVLLAAASVEARRRFGKQPPPA
jgi:uncharacterized membrane protein HdeD (DUF308 family)